jgi:hypothetical protein
LQKLVGSIAFKTVGATTGNRSVGSRADRLIDFYERKYAALDPLSHLGTVGISLLDECLELVLTGAAEGSTGYRDTQAVVRILFASAQHSVDVVGYAVYQGRQVFRVLTERMKELPSLRVRFLLNVPRERNDVSESSEIVRQFLQRFRKYDWQEEVRPPELYYDPRALGQTRKKTSLHAKCVLVDGKSAFISSANFTELTIRDFF